MIIRLFDFFFSSLAMIILLPFMLPIMLCLKMSGEHHVFYVQRRVGKGGNDFGVLKFATMLKNSPSLPGGILTQKEDPRILPMGSFLRRSKINELPQLANIMMGQMSFVGPRPQARRHYELYEPEVRRQIDKLTPGLTGIGSLVFRDEETILNKIGGCRDTIHDTIIAPYKGELEIWFANHRNFCTYLLVIFLTTWAVFRPDNKIHKVIFSDLPQPPEILESFV